MKVSAKTTSYADQVIALLSERGPLTTREIAEALPPQSRITCGHPDCTAPEHRRTYGTHLYQGDAYQLLAGMVQRKQIDRTPLDNTRPAMWWVR